MIKALQRLPKAEEQALIEVAVANGLDRNTLHCVMTRQRAAGRGRHDDRGGILAGRSFNISYDLMLCEYCGNLMPSAICPAKVLKIKEKLLGGCRSNERCDE